MFVVQRTISETLSDPSGIVDFPEVEHPIREKKINIFMPWKKGKRSFLYTTVKVEGHAILIVSESIFFRTETLWSIRANKCRKIFGERRSNCVKTIDGERPLALV